MARKRSTIWMHFDPLKNDYVKCQECGKIFLHRSGSSTSNLRKHLSTKHGYLFDGSIKDIKEPCPESCDYAQQSAENFEFGDPSSSTFVKIENIMDDPTGDFQAPTSSGSVFPAPTVKLEEMDIGEPVEQQTDIYVSHTKNVSLLQKSSNKQFKFHEMTLWMLATDMQPLTMVTNSGFRQFVNALNPDYQLPTKRALKHYLLPSKYNQILKQAKQLITESESVCLTTDGWRSAGGIRILAITAHYLTPSWEMQSILLHTFRFDASFDDEKLVTDEFMKMARDWKITNKISSIIAGPYYSVDFLASIGWKSLKCFAHTINSIVYAGLKSIGPLRNKIKNIIEYFRRHGLLEEQLRAMQFELPPGLNPLVLKKENKAQWTTAHAAYTRICELQEPLDAVIATVTDEIPKLSAEDWEALKEVLKMLDPFKEVVNELCGEKNYMPASKMILLQNGIKSVVQRKQQRLKNNTSKSFTEILLKSIQEEFTDIETTFAAKACFLDPRFKTMGFLGYSDETVDNVKKCLLAELNQLIRSSNGTDHHDRYNNGHTSTQIISDSDSDDDSLLWAEFNSRVKRSSKSFIPPSTAAIELNAFLEEPLLPRTECALKWWNARENAYPQLSKLAKKYVGILATSVPGERLYTEKGATFIYRRSRMGWNIARQMIFLNTNMKLFQSD